MPRVGVAAGPGCCQCLASLAGLGQALGRAPGAGLWVEKHVWAELGEGRQETKGLVRGRPWAQCRAGPGQVNALEGGAVRGLGMRRAKALSLMEPPQFRRHCSALQSLFICLPRNGQSPAFPGQQPCGLAWPLSAHLSTLAPQPHVPHTPGRWRPAAGRHQGAQHHHPAGDAGHVGVWQALAWLGLQDPSGGWTQVAGQGLGKAGRWLGPFGGSVLPSIGHTGNKQSLPTARQ